MVLKIESCCFRVSQNLLFSSETTVELRQNIIPLKYIFYNFPSSMDTVSEPGDLRSSF